MAIAFAQASIHTRSKGHSSVAASAYRTATCLTDERTGVVYDFTKRTEVLFAETMLPVGADLKYKDRELLWNEVEHVENRINSQLCKDVVLALPKELNLVHQIELAKRFANTHFVDNGLACDVAIHDDKDGNPHAHILVTMRRLEGTHFATHKARDLNPKFAKGMVVEGDYWGERWRGFQNDYFDEFNLNLAVDLNHIIPERHEGRIRDAQSHYVKQDNELIRDARINIALNHSDNLINHLSVTHSVFTRRDIETLLFKTFKSTDSGTLYLSIVEQVLGHKDVIALGANDSGIESYTTRNQYIAEAKLLKNIEQMQERTAHVYATNVRAIASRYTLNEEQSDALSYITGGCDISLLIGRPGVGKSYLLKPIKDYYEVNGCRVIGAALSGKVAKALEADTAIKSHTIASLNYRLTNNKLQLTKHDVLVIDEAGMVDFSSLSFLIDAANKAQAKLILVGDPDQLKPINKGEIFRGIASRTGYMELGQIRRQYDAGDREASLNMAKGNMVDALAHYENKGAIHFSDYSRDATTHLVSEWKTNITALSDIKENMMFAFSRAAVLSLNEQAREALQNKGIVGREEFMWQRTIDDSEEGLRTGDKVIVRFTDAALSLSPGDIGSVKEINKISITLVINSKSIEVPIHYQNQLSRVEYNMIPVGVGERILFRKNDKTFGVRNGDMAFVESINSDTLCARLDSGELVTLSKKYKHIDYGYASTVHKGQGMTVDNASVLIDSKYWDKYLAFVAMTRHRKNLRIYADRHQHPDMNALRQTLSRATIKDNVIDWPLDFAIRAGFDPDKMVGRALNKIAGVGHQIKNKWNYLVNYEAYLKAKDVALHVSKRQNLRAVAKEIAGYLDEKQSLQKQTRLLEKDAKKLGVNKSELPGFDAIYQRSVARDKQAHALLAVHGRQFEQLPALADLVKSINHDAARYDRYLAIKLIVEDKIPKEALIKEAAKIDLKKDYVHMARIAPIHGRTADGVYKQVESLQKSHRQALFLKLKQDYPVLAEYDKLFNERNRSSGFSAEQLDKALVLKAREITNNSTLCQRLQRDLPKFSASLMARIKGHGLDRGIDR